MSGKPVYMDENGHYQYQLGGDDQHAPLPYKPALGIITKNTLEPLCRVHDLFTKYRMQLEAATKKEEDMDIFHVVVGKRFSLTVSSCVYISVTI